MCATGLPPADLRVRYRCSKLEADIIFGRPVDRERYGALVSRREVQAAFECPLQLARWGGRERLRGAARGMRMSGDWTRRGATIEEGGRWEWKGGRNQCW
jgi:hypothetical protein